MTSPLELLGGTPLLGLMVVIAVGFTLGRLRFRGISLGAAGGTLFAGLVLGRLGVPAASSGVGPHGSVRLMTKARTATATTRRIRNPFAIL